MLCQFFLSTGQRASWYHICWRHTCSRCLTGCRRSTEGHFQGFVSINTLGADTHLFQTSMLHPFSTCSWLARACKIANSCLDSQTYGGSQITATVLFARSCQPVVNAKIGVIPKSEWGENLHRSWRHELGVIAINGTLNGSVLTHNIITHALSHLSHVICCSIHLLSDLSIRDRTISSMLLPMLKGYAR